LRAYGAPHFKQPPQKWGKTAFGEHPPSPRLTLILSGRTKAPLPLRGRGAL
jgi:hypothetical protein